MDNKIMITAHAGCMMTIPNSMESIKMAMDYETDFIEVDLRMTKDDIFVLSHDDMIRSDSYASVISESTLEELLIFAPGLVTLDTALETIHKSKIMLNLDIKEVHDYLKLERALRNFGMEERTVLSGCHKELAEMLALGPFQFKTLLSPEDGSLLQKEDDKSMVMAGLCADALKYGCYGINMNYKECSSEFVDIAKASGIPVFVWTVNEITDMKTCIEMGVDSITTDRIDLLNTKIYSGGRRY